MEFVQDIKPPLQDIAIGAIVVLRAGDFMPVDGQVVEGLGLAVPETMLSLIP